jgi:oligopeptide/dipeptide ABC transporter ATP-binding protein
MAAPLISAGMLKKAYPLGGGGFLSRRTGHLKAVDGVSFAVTENEALGIVGESGCGKSTLGRLLLYIEKPSSGTVHFKGEDLSRLGRKEMKAFRRKAQIIYQNPYAALDPRKTVGKTIEEPLVIHGVGSRSDRKARAALLLEKVGLRPEHARRYPHEFSGGQRQRIVIARALALNPSLLLADEPVSALDVSIQAQVINLLADLRAELGLTYLFISHDLSVIEHICDRVAVMYLGKIVETAPAREFFANPLHPYARALLDAAPVPDPGARRDRILLSGDVPSPIRPPEGCTFHPRCPAAQLKACVTTPPTLSEISPGRSVSCHLFSG